MTESECLQPPIGVYSAPRRRLEVGAGYVRFIRTRYPKSDRKILFDDIVAVKFTQGTGCNSGFLCVREKKDRDLAMPNTSMEGRGDDTTFVYGTSDNMKKVYDVYAFIKKYIDQKNL